MKKVLSILILVSFTWSVPSHAADDKANPFMAIDNLGFTRTFAEPLDFDLPDLSGKKHSLQEYKGKWIMLAFWATWCGPCRMELPELETLYNHFHQKNLVMLGVAADQGDASQIRKFASELNLSFPILHDQEGQVAGDYQATALPSLYLISPDWKLVGVLRGAKSWNDEGTYKEFENLLKLKKTSEKYFQDNANPAVGKGGVPIPEKLIPPELDVEKLDGLFSGDTSVLQIKIHWKGDPNKYLVKVPKVTFPEGIVLQGSISSGSHADEKEAILYYSYPLNFNKEGLFHLGPVIMSFQSIYGGAEQLSRHPGIDVEVKSRPRGIYYFTLAILLGVVILGLRLFVFKKKLKKSDLSVSVMTDWQSQLQDIGRLRLEGRKKEYSLELLQLYMNTHADNGEKNSKILALIEKVRFAGFELSEAELDYYEKEIKKKFEGEII